MIDDQLNDLFTFDDSYAKMNILLQDFIHKTSRSRLSMSKTDIDVLKSSYSAALTLLTDSFDMMIEQAEERRDNLLGFSSVKVISIGEDCFSRTLSTHWGLKPSARLGEKTHPFDLSVHPLRSIIHLMETDFSGYLEVDNLRYNEGNKIVVNKKLSITFNHEIGEKYAEDDFRMFRDLYQRRISNFYEDIAKSQRVLFLFHNEHPERNGPDIVLQLKDTIINKWPDKNMKFVCINTWLHGAEVKYASPKYADESQTLLIDAHYPYAGYVWHVPLHCFSKSGYNFEKRLIKQVRDFISSWYDENGQNSVAEQLAL